MNANEKPSPWMTVFQEETELSSMEPRAKPAGRKRTKPSHRLQGSLTFFPVWFASSMILASFVFMGSFFVHQSGQATLSLVLFIGASALMGLGAGFEIAKSER